MLLKKLVVLFFLLLFFLLSASFLSSKTSNDVIAIRILKNPENYSALTFYREKQFTGSPQAIMVDGYEGIRDGRTVYINAANISGGELYTNIYLISFNNNADAKTVDIFERLLGQWKFNTNFINNDFCNLSTDTSCLLDSDCPLDDHCLSAKARIVRDTKRLSELSDIKLALERYKNEKGYYPKLEAGSYLPHISISTWPSWKNALGRELKFNIPLDPINKLGLCPPNFNPITCWDEINRSFGDSDPADPAVNLPSNSRAIVYISDPNGSSFNLCAVMESGFVSGSDSGSCAGSEIGVNVIGTVTNNAPRFTRTNISRGFSGLEYTAYVEAIDPDEDQITWTIDVEPNDQWQGWSAPPELRDTGVENQKELYASFAGASGNYSFTITIDDGRGESNSRTSREFILAVDNNIPVLHPINCPSSGLVGIDYSCSSFSATDPDGHSIEGYLIEDLPPGLSYDSAGGEIMGIPTTVGDFTITVYAFDQFGAMSSPEEHTISIGLSQTFNSLDDWESGTNNNLIESISWLEANPVSTPYLWVANSGDNTVVRINTQTNEVHGPFNVGINPSRTSVNTNGDVWIANRSSANITHLDSNGNLIKTCPAGPGPRGIAIDAEGYVWVANHSDSTVFKFDYNNCDTPIEIYDTNLGFGGGYGAAADGLGNIWIVGPYRESGTQRDLTKINTLTGTHTVYPIGAYLYGITVDLDNNIWLAEWSGQRLRKVGQDGNTIGIYNLGMNCRAVAVDSDNNIWVTHSLDDRVTKLNNNGIVLFSICSDPNIDCNEALGAHPIGITAVADGHIWVVNYTTGRASKINQSDGTIVASVQVGLNPYTYSDMAGYMLRTVTSPGGSWLAEVDGTIENPVWQNLSWDENEPGDSQARVRVRSADSYTGLASAVWSPYFDSSSVDLSTIPDINKRWLQIEVDLVLSRNGTSPSVDNLNVTCIN